MATTKTIAPKRYSKNILQSRKKIIVIMDSIPDELLLCIVEKLDPKNDVNTILGLRRVNRKWCRVATPYVHVAVQNYQSDVDLPWNYARATDLLNYLCWKLAQMPELSDFIKEVASRPWKDARWKSRVGRDEMRRMYRRALLEAAPPTMTDDLKEKIVSEMLGDNADAMLAFVFTLCTKLEAVMVPAIDDGYGPIAREVIRFALSQPQGSLKRKGRLPILDSVKHFQLGDYVNGLSLTDALDILSLPRLQYLELGNLGDFTLDPSPSSSASSSASAHADSLIPLPLSCSTIINPIDITLESCRLSTAGLTTLLSACAHPRSLFIQMRTRSSTRPPSFVAALESAAGKGLEFLLLDTTAFEAGPDSPEAKDAFLRAISALHGLRTLVLARHDIPSVQALAAALPATLKELLVLGTDLEDEDGEEQVLRGLVRGVNTPALRRAACLPGQPTDWGLVYNRCLKDRKLPATKVLEWCECTVYE
ncbi:hypothetical protein F5Y04DRAFT_274522 [Hypomontagnella monticulosa]|nr:hypothetical protein F5Y04DRAFT_274522 [Hypomontagnella monticulosa]